MHTHNFSYLLYISAYHAKTPVLDFCALCKNSKLGWINNSEAASKDVLIQFSLIAGHAYCLSHLVLKL